MQRVLLTKFVSIQMSFKDDYDQTYVNEDTLWNIFTYFSKS